MTDDIETDYVKTMREFTREALGFAHGYLQGLVVVGYAAMFFLWEKAEDRLPLDLWSGVGLLLCISVGSYLAWEVFGFLFRQRIAMQQALAVGKPGEKKDPAVVMAQLAENLEKLKNFLPAARTLWYPAMFGILVPLALAWAVVLVAFAVELIRVICQTA